MFKNLSLRYKMLVVPLASALAFLIAVVVTLVLGSSSAETLDRIETGFYPAVETNELLVQDLALIQRTFQDAVAAEDDDRLSEADGIRDRFLEKLEILAANPVVDASDADQTAAAFRSYYETARRMTARMIAGDGGAGLTAAGRLEVRDRDVRPTQLTITTDAMISEIGVVKSVTAPESRPEYSREIPNADPLSFYRDHMPPEKKP